MNSDFPKIITELRKVRKLSQKQAAADLGISQALLSHYEKGIRECGLDFVVKLADYYNVSCDSLLGHSDDSTPVHDTHSDIEAIRKTAESLLSLCESVGGKELEKDMHSCIMLNFYKLLRMINKSGGENGELFSIPEIPAEDLADSVIMNICASIKLKSSRITEIHDNKIPTDNSIKNLIKSSENTISEFHGVCL